MVRVFGGSNMHSVWMVCAESRYGQYIGCPTFISSQQLAAEPYAEHQQTRHAELCRRHAVMNMHAFVSAARRLVRRTTAEQCCAPQATGQEPTAGAKKQPINGGWCRDWQGPAQQNQPSLWSTSQEHVQTATCPSTCRCGGPLASSSGTSPHKTHNKSPNSPQQLNL